MKLLLDMKGLSNIRTLFAHHLFYRLKYKYFPCNKNLLKQVVAQGNMSFGCDSMNFPGREGEVISVAHSSKEKNGPQNY